MKHVLETDRLVLRQFTEADAPRLLSLDSDPEVMRYIGPFGLPDEPAYLERIRSYFLPYYERGPYFGFWVAELKSTGKFLGWFHLRDALDYRFGKEAGFVHGEFDIGYRMIRSSWGKGYSTEMTRALVARGFARPEVHSIVACVLAANLASCRVLQKVGLKPVAKFILPGFDQPAHKYWISRETYESARATSVP